MDPTLASSGEDAALVAAARDGDAEAFRVLVRRYWPLMVGLAIGQVGESTEAEDIAQEAFILAYRRLGDLRDPACFAGWLARIVRNQSADTLRQRARRRVVSLDDLPEPPDPAVEAYSTNPGLTEPQRRFIRQVVRSLPEKFRTVVMMRFITNLSLEEIARQMGKRPGTVRVWLHRALKQLRKDLARLQKEVQES